jgi:methylmalonyl-CoA decarboxylase
LRVALIRAQPGVKVRSAGHDANELPPDGRDPLGFDDPLRRVNHLVDGAELADFT